MVSTCTAHLDGVGVARVVVAAELNVAAPVEIERKV